MQARYIFILLILLVLPMQYDILKPALEIGLTPDDWSFIFWYKLLGSNPWSKFFDEWAVRGPYTTVPLYYTGIINSLVGFDFLKQQIISIFFKILATLILFPLVALVFKSRLLAFLTTILFAMSYPSSGALETAVEPSEYLGMFFMGIFLMIYYHVVKNNIQNLKWLILITIILALTIFLSVMRLYPLLVFVPAVEIFILTQRQSKAAFRESILRLGLLFSPFILITLFRPSVILSYIGVIPTVLQKVLEGNLHLLLTPLQGLGHMLSMTPYLGKLFGNLNMESMLGYLTFILMGPAIFFGLITLILSLIKSKHRLKFFCLTFGLNFLLEILVYFIAIHRLSIPADLRLNFDNPRIYLTLLGLYILVLSFVYWLEWKIEGKKNNLLLALWIGPAGSFLFIILTWLLGSEDLAFGGAQDHYLMIPAFGTSLFIAGLLILIYKKSKVIKLGFVKGAISGVIPIILIAFYLLNRDLIHTYFNRANENGRAAIGQKMIQSRFRESIRDIDLTQPALFYFDTSELSGDGPFYTEGLLSPFPFFMRFQGNDLVDGCSEVFYESKTKLASLIRERNKEKGFVYRGLCLENGVGGYKDIFYKPENFYAFKIKSRDFIDIKEQILKELGF